MTTEIGKAAIRVTFDRSQVEADAKKSLVPAIGKIADDMAHIFAGKKIFDFAKAGFQELKDSAAVAAQTTAALKSTGDVAGVTGAEVGKLATHLEHLSGTDDELIQSGENLLLTFTNIRNEAGKGNDIFTRATTAALDLSKAFGQDMTSSAILVGKALNDPIKGLTALQRVGVTFTAAQKDTIKALVDSGQTMEAQKVILGELNREVGGSAAAYGKTLPGQIDIAKQSLNDMKGEMVAGFAPALQLGAEGVSFLTNEFGKLPSSTQAVVGGVTIAGGAVAALARPINDVLEIIGKLKPAELAAAAGVTAHTAAVEADTAVLEGNTAASVANLYATERQGNMAQRAIGSVGGLGQVIGAAGVALTGFTVASSIWASAMGKADKDAESLRATIHKGLDSASFEELNGKLKETNKQIDEMKSDKAGSNAPWDADYRRGLGKGIAVLDQFKVELTSQIGAADDLAAATGRSKEAALEYVRSQAALGKSVDGTNGFLDQENQDLEAQAQKADQARAALKTYTDQLSGQMDGVEETWKAQLNLNEATARQKEVLADGKSTGDDRLKAIIDTMDASVGLTSAQWALDGATLEGKEKIEAQITTLQGLEAKLDKNDPLRQNLDDYINQLKDAEGTFEAKLHLTFTSDEATVRITPGKKQALAGGGFVAPHEVFTGAERGLELMALPKHGTYQAPPSGGFVIPHTQSEQILEGLAGSERPSGHAVHIETAVFGSEGALADLDWWAATRLAGV